MFNCNSYIRGYNAYKDVLIAGDEWLIHEREETHRYDWKAVSF